MTFRMIVQLWNTITPAIVTCNADLTDIFRWSLEREFMYFAGKLVYLIIRASNQLAVSKRILSKYIIHEFKLIL